VNARASVAQRRAADVLGDEMAIVQRSMQDATPPVVEKL